MATLSPLPIPNAARIEPSGATPTGRDQTGYSVGLTGPLTGALAAELADDCKNFVLPIMKNIQSNQFSWDTIRVHDLLRPEVVSLDVPVSPAITGNVATAITDSASSPLGSIRTATAGRSFRGRFYVPALTPAQFEDDTLTTDNVGLLSDIGTILLEIVSRVVGAKLGVPSRKLGVITQAVAVLARAVIGSQRRRRKGVGT